MKRMAVTIEKIVYGGDGLASYNGKKVFVEDGVPGDKVLVKVASEKKDYYRGELTKVLEASPFRQEAPCPYAFKCGGCQWQHIQYAKQMEFKKQIATEFLYRAPEKVLAMESDFHWRNKIAMPVRGKKGEIFTGFYQKRSHRVVPIPNCMLQIKGFDKVMKNVLNLANKLNLRSFNEQTMTGMLRHLVLRGDKLANEMILILVTKTRKIPFAKSFATELMKTNPELKGVLININPKRGNYIFGENTHLLAGREFYEETLNGIRYRIPASSFFQVNPVQAERMFALLKEWLLPDAKDVVDLFCGVGAIALQVAQPGRKIIGMELDKHAIAYAQENARINQIQNCTFVAGDAYSAFHRLPRKTDVVIVDPPRKGLDKSSIQWIIRSGARQLLYVSCNPAAFKRDLGLLKDHFQLQKYAIVDLFPHTYHFEIVASLERKESE